MLKKKNSISLDILYANTVAVTSLEGENQILLNLFTEWSQMTIKSTFTHLVSIIKAIPQHNANQNLT